MNHNDVESIRQNNAAIVKDICAKFGLYGNVVNYAASPIEGSSLNRMYIVAGFDEALQEDTLPKHLRPQEILRTLHRNEKLFYPRIWALDLFQTQNEISATQALADYCKTANLIARIYAEYGLRVPTVLRHSEVHQLINYFATAKDPNMPEPVRKKSQKDLDWFFKREKSKSKFRKNWLSYFRSEKFPDDKGPLQRLLGYFRRDRSEISLAQLMDTNPVICKLELQEYEFKILSKIIRERYPFVSYAVGEKEIVDHGVTKATGRDDCAVVKHVTAEEYAVIRKERFAEEGWDCVAQLKPAYWEFRDIYYRKCDEPIIASIYQHITLQYAKCDPLGELKQRGTMLLQKVPANDFMNFVSLAKANKVRFYIDARGEYETPSLDTVNVLYNEYQQPKMAGVIERMIQDKVSFSHVLNTPTRPSLNSVIGEIEAAAIGAGELPTQQKSHGKKKNKPSHEK